MKTIRRMTILIHGKTEPEVLNPRQLLLTAEGKAYVTAVRTAWGRQHYDLICHSPSSATIETSLILASLTNETATINVHDLLFESGTVFWEAFAKLGNRPLAEYFEHPGVEDAINVFIRNCGATIAGLFEGRKARNALIVGHPVLIPALCTHFRVEALQCFERLFDNCHGYTIRFRETGETIGYERIGTESEQVPEKIFWEKV